MSNELIGYVMFYTMRRAYGLIPLLAKPIRIGLLIRLADIGNSKERSQLIVRVRLLGPR